MDAKRFDAITKAWSRVPRRRLLGGLAAGALGPLLGLGGREASAQTCQDKDDCAAGEVCKNNVCVGKCGNPGTCNSGFANCSNDPTNSSCFCGKKPGGGGFCLLRGFNCALEPGCRRQRDCPEGTVCATGCCGSEVPKFVCAPPCGAV